MPYRKRYTRKRMTRRSNRSRKAVIYRAPKARSLPMQYVDILFTGDDISTTPGVTSLPGYIASQVSNQYLSWTRRTVGATTTDYFNTIFLSHVYYQLRFQVASGDDENSLRLFLYRSSTPWNDVAGPEQIFDGSDIDQPPDTETVSKVYLDKYINLLQFYNGGIVRQNRTIKGSLNIKTPFHCTYNSSSTLVSISNGDCILSRQSDSTSVTHPKVYGYVRMYFRMLQ